MRIVLDTNVTISALLWRGAPFELLRLVRESERIRLFASPVLIAELAEVLRRPGLSGRLRVINQTPTAVLASYLDAVDLVVPEAIPRVVMDDSDDDHVVAAAVAAGADLIVSGDRHLLGLSVHAGIRIIAPAEALRLI